MKKNLEALLFSGLILLLSAFIGAGKTYAQGSSNPLARIPERLRSYEDGRSSRRINFPKYTYNLWDVDSDGKIDVMEAFRILGWDSIGIYSYGEAFGYAFDADGNGKFSDDEFLADPAEDGLNGNEKWLDSLPKEPFRAEDTSQGI